MKAELRLGYQETDAGIIPEDWTVTPLNKVTDPNRPISYGIVQTGRPVHNGVKCVRVVDFDKGRVNEADLITTTAEISASYKRTLLAKGDLVIALRGRIGELALIDEQLVGANLTRGVALIAPREGYDSKFLLHYLSSPSSKRIFEKNLNGSALQEIPIAALRKIPAVTPPLPEQRAIAAALSDVDALINGLDQLIVKKRDMKQAAMQQLLTGESRLPGFDGAWEVMRLGDLFDVFAGGDFDSARSRQVRDERHPFPIYSNAITNAGLYGFCSYSAYPACTITVTARGTVGVANYRCHPYTAIGRVLVLQPKVEINGQFFSESINNQINFVVESTGVPQLTAPQLTTYELPTPPYAEQTAIAAILSDMDVELTALEARWNKTRDLKQGMMQELLTGRIRLI
jgi:type I restriction enzyme S subunit